jgi:hypothetical protein
MPTPSARRPARPSRRHVVPPGTYDIGGISFDDYSDGNPMHAYGQSASVVVTAGATTRVNLYVQIR